MLELIRQINLKEVNEFQIIHNFDKLRNHKQIPMKEEIFFKEPPMVCMNQECGGILIFLANSLLEFAWIIGIYGKPIF